MKKCIVFIPVCILLISGCTTIHFDNGRMPTREAQISKWHHNYALALYEGSDPVNLRKECNDKNWESIKTELTFLNALAGGVVNNMVGIAIGMPGGAPIWYPKYIEITCGE